MIQQRTDSDCVLCCLAMALGLGYDELVAKLDAADPQPVDGAGLGTWFHNVGCMETEDKKALQLLGLEEDRDFRKFTMSPEWCTAGFLRNILWGRRSILTVRSKNAWRPGASHALYWDGRELQDPSTRKTFAWSEVEPTEFIVFNERPGVDT